MKLLCDIETDNLDPDKVQTLHCLVLKDLDNGRVYSFKGLTDECKNLLANATSIVGHNFCAYDYRVIERFAPGLIDPKVILDTLVLSKLLKYNLDDGEGHSLEAWGNRFGSPKHPSPDFNGPSGTSAAELLVYSDEMLEYCKQDVEINAKLYEYLREHMHNDTWYQAIETEMRMAWICLDMHLNGFKYDKEVADKLLNSLQLRLQILDDKIKVPDHIVPNREYTPRLTKHGTISRNSVPRDWINLAGVHEGCSFTTFSYSPFNSGSYRDLTSYLDKCGWRPVEPTKTGKGWKINEVNLATLPETAPEAARKLVERMLIASRVRTLTEWSKAYDPSDGRVHGDFDSIGTWPGRMGHRRPNMANVATKKSIKYKGEVLRDLAIDLGGRMRSLWTCSDSSWLVGTDMEAAHVRLFAHYIDDKAFTQAVITGDKKHGTDVHSLNKQVLGDLCPDRDLAKTFLFSFFNGAGPPKVAEIFGCSIESAAKALAQFNRRYPGIKKLREELIPVYARQGWFPGLDGRQVTYTQEHGMFAGMLQSGESIVMKMANILWRKRLGEQGINYRQVNLVHDEYVTECSGDEGLARQIGLVQSESIRDIGVSLRLKCPLAGEYKVGKNWLEVH